MDEKQAVARLKQGDPSGLEALVHSYQVRAVRAAALILGDSSTAEDIVQNAFIHAAEKIDRFDDSRPFGPWFLRSVVNAAVKAAVRQKRFAPLEDDEEAASIDLADPAPLPEELVEQEETSLAVWRALQKLPPDQRSAIVLRYYLDLSEDEMAEKLHRPVGTIKWWLHTARRKLTRLLRLHQAVEWDSSAFERKSGTANPRLSGDQK